MKKATLLCLAATLAAMAGSAVASAQMPTHPQYVKYWGDGERFSSLYPQWQAGQPFSTERADDEEFFISRVRPRERFTDQTTQVKQELSTERKLLWWVPYGVAQWNAIPSYFFNSEVFSTWSYIDHWGNWTAPYLRLPAAFTDVAHKNGVSVSATSTVPFGATLNHYDGHGKDFKAAIDGQVDKYLKFLRYYGIDGAGYNSEFNWQYQYLSNSFEDFLANVGAAAAEQNFKNYSNVWYSLTNNKGQISGSSWDALTSGNSEYFQKNGKLVSSHFFLNYNWTSSHFNTSKSEAERLGRSTYDVYAGMNMQKGSGISWTLLSQYPFSIGVWGAHNANMIFENRTGSGSNPMLQQKGYQRTSENVFTGGSRNPIRHGEYGRTLPSGHQSSASFFGMSKMIVARSTMSGDLDREPFVTYLNLGNGRFFNIQGDKVHSGEWYNLGLQDFMPTWRWWQSTSFMGRTESDIPAQPLNVEFTWEDAWFGGSCLEVSGQTSAEYLQLFKTKYAVKNGDVLSIRYKVIRGTGAMRWATTSSASGGSEVGADILKASDKIQQGEWVEAKITIGQGMQSLRIPENANISLIGLKFVNTSADFAVRIGEISLSRGTYPTPNAPTIKKAIPLENGHLGHDFKLIYSMGDLKSDGTVTYNDEVNTWYFKVYSQQEGENEVFCTATTSWAAYMVNAKLNLEGTRRVRYGVRAVSLDGRTESPITWSEYINLPDARENHDFSADFSVVNPGEAVKISFDDPKHPAAQQWQLKKAGELIQTISGGTSATFTLSAEGAYDVECTLANGQMLSRPSFITVINPSAGTSPRISTLTANGQSGSSISLPIDQTLTMAYTANRANGAVSRALRIEDKTFKIPRIFGDLDVRLGNAKLPNSDGGLTVTFWVRPLKTVFARGEDGIRLLDISKPKESWPMSEWSFFWVNYGGAWENKGKARDSFQGFQWTKMNTGYDSNDAREKFEDTNPVQLNAGTWYHITVSLGYDLSAKIYVNGKLISQKSGSNTRSTVFSNSQWDLNISRYAKFASALDGYIDEVRVYNRVLADNEVPGTMTPSANPAAENGLKAYFDFESDTDAQGNFSSRVGTVKASLQGLNWLGEGKQEWTNVVSVPFGPSTGWIAGSSYPVTTTATWEAPRALFGNQTDTNGSGSVNVTFTRVGVYPVTLTLDNAWGEDRKTFNLVDIQPSSTALTEVIDLTVFPNPFVEDVRIRFAEGGAYDVAVYDLSGGLVTREAVSATAGDIVRVDLAAPSGIYMMRITGDNGRTLRTIKLQKK